MKHKHYDMVVAKAGNMDLILFAQSKGCETYGNWTECNKDTLPKNSEFCNYFLCLPQHKEVCLHWLNGGDAELKHASTNGWTSFSSIITWDDGCVFMQADCKFRIKPRKEKRWIGVRSKDGATTMAHAKIQKARSDVVGVTGNWQFIEIEVDV